MKSPSLATVSPFVRNDRWARVRLAAVAVLALATFTSHAYAEPSTGVNPPSAASASGSATADADAKGAASLQNSSSSSEGVAGELPTGVEVISANGSITRAPCPYTCAARSIPKEHCREWRSKMYGDKCYVQDLRLPSSAISEDGAPSDAANGGRASEEAESK